MGVSAFGHQFIRNISQPQNAASSDFLGHFALAVSASGQEFPTTFVGWLYLHYVRGPQSGSYGIFYLKRASITRDGAYLSIPSIPGIVVPGDAFAGFQLNAVWTEAGINWTDVWVGP